ncbi:MAG: hypothetical protein QOI35_89, partial [Cryptosporangiaceae bacterium]|nr:hypothetical protein [Cryptosporangiaceae bacterium]
RLAGALVGGADRADVGRPALGPGRPLQLICLPQLYRWEVPLARRGRSVACPGTGGISRPKAGGGSWGSSRRCRRSTTLPRTPSGRCPHQALSAPLEQGAPPSRRLAPPPRDHRRRCRHQPPPATAGCGRSAAAAGQALAGIGQVRPCRNSRKRGALRQKRRGVPLSCVGTWTFRANIQKWSLYGEG